MVKLRSYYTLGSYSVNMTHFLLVAYEAFERSSTGRIKVSMDCKIRVELVEISRIHREVQRHCCRISGN